METALYDEDAGFFAVGRGPTGRSDFVTSPETGSLFGLIVANAIEKLWVEQGSPREFTVLEAGAGSGRLCREVLRSDRGFNSTFNYITVERSEALRQVQEVTLGKFSNVSIVADLPDSSTNGVIIANELLDNLAFDIAEFTSDGWAEVRVGLDNESVTGATTPNFVEVLAPLDAQRRSLIPEFAARIGDRLPMQVGIVEWIARAAECIETGAMVIIDYAGNAEDLARRGGWLRTYRDHTRGSNPLMRPGETDITSDVVLEPLRDAIMAAGFRIESETTQSDWLSGLGIGDEVATGEAGWLAGAARGDLEALIGRSRATEAAMLTDPEGLGGFTVIIARRE